LDTAHRPRADRLRHASRARRAREKEQLRETILSAAAALFDETGYAGFSLRKVAERIGYSPTTIYLYFADKDALLFAVCREGFKRFYERLRFAFDSTADPRARLEAMGRAYFAFAQEYPAHYRLMFTERVDFLLTPIEPEGEPAVGSLGLLQEAISLGMAAGVFEPGDPEAVADAVWAAVHGVATLTLPNPPPAAQLFDEQRAQRLREETLRQVGRGIARGKEYG